MANETDKTAEAVADTRDDQIKALKAEIKKLTAKKGPELPAGDYASFGGQIYPIVGDYRADNTFVEVKRGHCDEGLTLLAIQRQH